jgi:rhodanese-related sulfurtransferase
MTEVAYANTSASTTSDDPVQRAAELNTPFAGSVTPQDAWRLTQEGKAILVDVRTNEERKFVGYVPESIHVAWATGTSMNRNPRFAKEVETKIKDKTATILFLCRSGKRSTEAATALAKAGFTGAFNILEGFEGDLNEAQQRGTVGGWRINGLPWVQD